VAKHGGQVRSLDSFADLLAVVHPPAGCVAVCRLRCVFVPPLLLYLGIVLVNDIGVCPVPPASCAWVNLVFFIPVAVVVVVVLVRVSILLRQLAHFAT
jgi:hypothetical protein